MNAGEDHYAVLGLNPAADDVVVHAAWRALLRKHHPDTNPADPAGIKARKINEAFAILGKPGARAAYDRMRLSRPSSPPHRRAPYVTPNFRPIPRRRLSLTRLLGGALLTLTIIPTVSVALLAYPATHDALVRIGRASPFAAGLVARLDVLEPAPTLTPAPTPGADSEPPEVATTR